MEIKHLAKQRKRSSAIGLIEMILVLAVIAALTIVSVRYYASVKDAMKVNSVLSDMKAIHEAIKGWAEINSDWTTPPTINSLIIAQLLPARFLGPQRELGFATYEIDPVMNTQPTTGVRTVTVKLGWMMDKYCQAVARKTAQLTLPSGCSAPILGYGFLTFYIQLDDL